MNYSFTGNTFLDTLAVSESQRLLEGAKLRKLAQGTKLYLPEETPRWVWFLTGGVASFTFTSSRGTTIELAMLGREGVIGAFAVLGTQKPVGECTMQLDGAGFQVPLHTLQSEFRATAELRGRMLEFVEQQMSQAFQIVACNRLHSARQRFARWLLMVRDRIDDDVLPMTQETLANMLGTRRTTVVEVAGELQRRGGIDYRRGVIRIVDRAKLEDETCECYPLLRDRYIRLYAAPPPKL